MIKYLIMDVDGTLTDGKIYMANDGELFKAFDIKDGCGIKDVLPIYDIEPIIITARNSEIMLKRCQELGITRVYQGVRDKLKKLQDIVDDLSQCAYIGDDILDLKCIIPIVESGGIAACPSNAVDKVKESVCYICKHKGGEGAVRDFIDWLVYKEEMPNISQKVNSAIEYVRGMDVYSMPIGKYEINDGSYFMIQEYMTRKEQDCRLESHRKYIDVQWILRGVEKIKIYPVEKSNLKVPYNDEKDVSFWETSNNMMECILSSGGYVVLYPNDAHMPSISVGDEAKVRKLVIKVKI